MSELYERTYHIAADVRDLVSAGYIEPTGMGSGAGAMSPDGPRPQVVSSYRILRKEKDTLRKILPLLSWHNKQDIRKEFGDI